MPCPMGRGTMHRGAMHWGTMHWSARVMGNLAKRVDWQGRKEGGETGRNRGAAGSGIAGRVDTGSGQRKTPRGNLGAAKEGHWPTCQPLPARAERTMRATKKAPRRRYPRARNRSVTGTPSRPQLPSGDQGGQACSQLRGGIYRRSRRRTL